METCNNNFKIKFRGVRGSHPVAHKNFLEYGGNTSCVEVNVGGHLIILDAGTGIISLGKELVETRISSSEEECARTPISATILLTHIHQDHIQGLPFFKPANALSSNINIIGYSDYEENIAENLSELLYGKSFPLNLNEIVSNLGITNIFESDIIILNKDSNEALIKKIDNPQDATPKGEEVIISCMKSNSHPHNGVMVYKISYKDKSVVFATDKENYVGSDKRLALFARNCDLLIHDAQYTDEDYLSPLSTKQGYGHSTFEMAIEVAKLSKTGQLAFFHYDPNYDDEKLNRLEHFYKSQFEKCFMSKEGQEIILL